MDKERAEVYELLVNMVLKALVTIVCLGVYVTIVVHLLKNPTLYLAIPSTVLPGAFYPIITHFFPAAIQKAVKKPVAKAK
jgi:hypothetical protein